MTSGHTAKLGLELIWVNASSRGPFDVDFHDTALQRIIRILPGQKKLFSRSSSTEDQDSIVNDLADTVYFKLAKVVSRQHAVIDWLAGQPIITDVGSSHGTFVSRRSATVSREGRCVEADPFAENKKVEGVMTLRHGDLVQFGRPILRNGIKHHAVRCYVRFIDTAVPSSTFSPVTPSLPVLLAKSSCSYGVDEASLDSDIISIDAETFHSSGASSVGPLRTKAALPSEDHTEPLLDSDQQESESVPSDSDMDSPSSQSESECECGMRSGDSSESRSDAESDSPICVGVPKQPGSDASGSSCAPTESPCTLSVGVPASTSVPHATDAPLSVLESTVVSKSLAEESTQTAFDPSTVGDDTVLSDEEAAEPAEAQESPGKANTTDATLSEPASVASNEETPPQALAQAVEAPQKRKRKSESPASDHVGEDSADGEVIDEDDSERSFASSSAASALSSPCTSVSGSPPPVKKRRITHASFEVRNSQPRSGSRSRNFRAFASKALYATSLLSIGFFSGSLFTFKSMLNAAAAANAAGSGRQ